MRRTVMKSLLVALLIVAGGTAVLFSPWPESIVIENGEQKLGAMLYEPRGTGPFPAVVLLHGCAGILDKHAAWAKKLVGWGYAALIVDSFSALGIESLCDAEDEVWQRVSKARSRDADAALAFLASRKNIDARNIAMMGWSYGGTTVLELLNEERTDYRAAIALYPSCWQYLQQHPEPQFFDSSAPLLILHGADDDWTLIEHCRKLTERVDQRGKPVSLREYSGARHDFDNPAQTTEMLRGVRIEKEGASGDVTVAYDRAAHTAALKDVKHFLGASLSDE